MESFGEAFLLLIENCVRVLRCFTPFIKENVNLLHPTSSSLSQFTVFYYPAVSRPTEDNC
jgi:hypothetical protein